MTQIASRFCTHVAMHDVGNATAKIGAWFIGAAQATGGFPLAVSYREIRDGFTRDGITVHGTASRHATILQSIAELEDAGFLTVGIDTPAEGESRRKQLKLFDWKG